MKVNLIGLILISFLTGCSENSLSVFYNLIVPRFPSRLNDLDIVGIELKQLREIPEFNHITNKNFAREFLKVYFDTKENFYFYSLREQLNLAPAISIGCTDEKWNVRDFNAVFWQGHHVEMYSSVKSENKLIEDQQKNIYYIFVPVRQEEFISFDRSPNYKLYDLFENPMPICIWITGDDPYTFTIPIESNKIRLDKNTIGAVLQSASFTNRPSGATWQP